MARPLSIWVRMIEHHTRYSDSTERTKLLPRPYGCEIRAAPAGPDLAISELDLQERPSECPPSPAVRRLERAGRHNPSKGP